jgi:lipopolysaccharide/colanic/teichoic acid biosynthesis glycosyltransferase
MVSSTQPNSSVWWVQECVGFENSLFHCLQVQQMWRNMHPLHLATSRCHTWTAQKMKLDHVAQLAQKD